jgi:hypothetical protein
MARGDTLLADLRGLERDSRPLEPGIISKTRRSFFLGLRK